MNEPSERVAAWREQLDGASASRMVERALEAFGDEIAISFSGAEDVLLVEYAHQWAQAKAGRRYRVFTLDTGRLHPETYRYLDRVEQHYGIRLEVCFPRAEAVQDLVRAKGLFSFFEDGHHECCSIRKVEPLRRQLAGLRAWITGQRRDQSPGTRADVPRIQEDPAFRGVDGAPLLKLNPLANTTSDEVWNAITAFEVPINALHERGYVSIGCEPCTRAVLPHEHERAGRWWWEEATKKECGLHVATPTQGPASSRR